MSSNLRMIVSGGGTGGHFFPAQAIFKSLCKRGVEMKYIGSRFGIESNYFNNINEATLLNIRGFQRHFTLDSVLKNSLFPYRFIKSYLQSRKIITDYNPHVLIGTGGYSSGLPLLAAIHKGVKTVIQEQNSFPGVTTRKLGKKATKVCIAFEESRRYFEQNNVIRTGNPIREDIKEIDKIRAKQFYQFDATRSVIAILGGSQGSTPLNLHFEKYFEQYISSKIQILWQCGKNDYSKLRVLNTNDGLHIIPFTENMNNFYSAADIIISRSGALTLSEMSCLGKAMILIPFPKSAGNHQIKNAETFTNSGAAILINQFELKTGKMEKTVLDLINSPKKISIMEKNSKNMSTPNALEKITQTIMEIAKS